MSETYEYIKRNYRKTFEPKDKVVHTVTKLCGRVMRPRKSHLHYVQVHFGDAGVGLCHPDELEIMIGEDA